ncbi:MAG: carboxylesterase family protein [Bdellovibrionales bacterium]|nr:carboxylesterase family protein [Bdellovibrionales bacterium]
MKTYLVVLSLLVFAGAKAAEPKKATVVELDTGFIEGAVNLDVMSFKGIPYAAPPVGHFRWRETQPMPPWIGVRKTMDYGSDCMQKPDPQDAAPPTVPSSEDCLYMNVWRPAIVPMGQSLPVLVWVYGGGFVNGGSSPAIYDGSSFAKKGMIFVSFNYRLGRFGFFAHPALTAAQEGPLGNYGLMDQIYAFQWVRRNIAAFGGDPNQVTAIGESAGGISILTMMTSQQDKKLFDRAVVMSGGGRSTILGGLPLNTGPTKTAETVGINFAVAHGVQGAGVQALAALRSLPAEDVRGDLNMSSLISGAESQIYAGGPIVDGKIFIAQPGKVLSNGKAAKIPLVIGTTGRDISAILGKSKEEVFALFGAKADEARTVYDPDGLKTADELNQEVGSDQIMNEPARFAAKAMTSAGNKTWVYRFYYVADVEKSKVKGAGHSSELPFLFETLEARFGKDVSAADQSMGSMLNNYVSIFAKTGDPNGSEQPMWMPFDPGQSNILSFQPDASILMGKDPWKARLDLMEWLNNNMKTP